MELKEAAEKWYDSVKYKSDLSGTPIEGFHAGAYWGRGQMNGKYEKLIAFIDLLAHGVLNLDQHEILDKVLEFSGITEDELRRIRKVYPPELLESKTIKEE